MSGINKAANLILFELRAGSFAGPSETIQQITDRCKEKTDP
jgi:hypothetical protein